MSEIHKLISSGVKLSKDVKIIPFSVLVKITTGFDVIPLNLHNDLDAQIFSQISHSASNFISYVQRTRQRFQGDRINDVGKRIEEVFVEELKKTELHPVLLGKSGYPDMKIIDSEGQITYLESKAVSKKWDSTFRSFYYTDGKKLDSNGHHLLIAWNIQEESSKYWQVNGFKICDLSNLSIKTKLEFNASNKDLYCEDLVLIDES